MDKPGPAAATNDNTAQPLPGARTALTVLLAINLFNYIDRYILAAVLPAIAMDRAFAPISKFRLGLLTTAFVASYLGLSPLFGWLGDRMSRWLLVGAGVGLWSLASGGSGLATGFFVLLLTRALVGVGEAAYGPVAPSILSDMYPVRVRGQVMAWFYAAIPFGSALGYVLGGTVAHIASEWHWADSLGLPPGGWRWAFFVVVLPGLFLALWCAFMREPQRGAADSAIGHTATLRDCLCLARIPSFVYNTIAATAMCFAVGGVAVWMPTYIYEREVRHDWNAGAAQRLQESKGAPLPEDLVGRLAAAPATAESMSATKLREHLLANNSITKTEWDEYGDRFLDAARDPKSPSLSFINIAFGGIVAISGILATLVGGWLGDRLTARFPGAYFQVSGWAAIAGIPLFLLVLVTPFPLAWAFLFLSVVGLFFNTGPSNTILANVAPPPIRSSAFAINILAIHILGDAISPAIIGFIADEWSMDAAFVALSVVILTAAVSWLLGTKHLQRDTRQAPTLLATPPSNAS